MPTTVARATAGAPALAAVPGLISKVWLADEASNTYGGIYWCVDRDAMETFGRSEFFQAFASNASIANIAARDFGILEGPGRITGAPAPAAAAA